MSLREIIEETIISSPPTEEFYRRIRQIKAGDSTVLSSPSGFMFFYSLDEFRNTMKIFGEVVGVDREVILEKVEHEIDHYRSAVRLESTNLQLGVMFGVDGARRDFNGLVTAEKFRWVCLCCHGFSPDLDNEEVKRRRNVIARAPKEPSMLDMS